MIFNDEKDPDYFALVQGKQVPKGSTIPHPVDWQGRKSDKIGEDQKVYTVGPGDFAYKFKTKSGRRRKLTEKQIKMAQFMLKGNTRRQAMLKAGYSVQTASKSFMRQQKTVMSFFEGVKGRFVNMGMDEDFVATKMEEWLNANKVITVQGEREEVPDYKTQIEAYDRFKSLIEPKMDTKGKKKEMVLTEWITGETTEEVT